MPKGERMSKIRSFFREELAGWKAPEIAWLGIACLVILCLSIYWHDTWYGIVSAVTGVACVVCTGKGKLSAYIYGTINVLLYAFISFQAHYYGEVMLNLIYYFPMEFYGFYVWSKYMDSETHEVEKRLMKPMGFLILILADAAGTFFYGLVLQKLGGSLPFVDAFTTVSSVAAMILSVFMYAEQWLLWIIIDVVTIYLWGVAFAGGSDTIATLLMWVVYLINAVIMFVRWYREARTHEV